MADSASIWFRLGYALEQARHAPSSGATARGHLRTLAERARSSAAANLGRQSGRRPVPDGGSGGGAGAGERPERAGGERAGRTGGERAGGAGGGAPSRGRDEQGAHDEAVARARDVLDTLMAAGAGSVVARVLGVWTPRHRPGVTGLLRGGLAGAAAAWVREFVAPIVRGRTVIRVWDDEMPRDLMAGAARGLLYAGVVDGRLPGGPLVRGVAYGFVEHLLSPVGGLSGLLGDRAPHRRIPVLAGLFEDYEPGEDTLADHLAFAVVLAILYGGGAGGSEEEDRQAEEQGADGDVAGRRAREAYQGNGTGQDGTGH